MFYIKRKLIIKECYCKTGKSTKKTNINKNTEYAVHDFKF